MLSHFIQSGLQALQHKHIVHAQIGHSFYSHRNLTLERHGKLTGGLGNVIDKIYGDLTDVGKRHGKETISKRIEDLEFFVDFLREENLTSEKKGRAFRSFPKANNNIKVDIKKLCQKINSAPKN